MADLPLAGRRVTHADDAASRWAGELLCALGALATLPATEAEVRVPAAPGSGAAADWAASGAMMLTGRSHGPPLPAPGQPATAARGALLALAALTAAAGSTVELAGHELLGERAALADLHRQAPWSPGGAFRVLRCADGWLGVSLPREDDRALVGAWLEEPSVDDPWALLDRRLPALAVEPAAHRAQLLGVAAAVVPQRARARGRVFGVRRTGPGRARRDRALVVDLSALWAGPLCAHLLGLGGARVVKVESVTRPDGARAGPPAFFDLLHAGHESVALDLRTDGGRRALHDLVMAADCVVESARPRAMAQLGIDRTTVPGVWVSITAYDRTGPQANWVGYGDDCAAAAGLVACEPGSANPIPCGDALADPLAGAHAAVAALACLATGGAWTVDVALHEVAAATLRTGGTEGTDGDSGPALPPRARPTRGSAAVLGEHTAVVLHELAGDAG